VRHWVGHGVQAGEWKEGEGGGTGRVIGAAPARPPTALPRLSQDLANFKYCGVPSDILDQVEGLAPGECVRERVWGRGSRGTRPLTSRPHSAPAPGPPPPTPKSNFLQILAQLKSLSSKQVVVAAGALAVVGLVAFCAFKCCARCGLCVCLPACCGGRRRRLDRTESTDATTAALVDALRRMNSQPPPPLAPAESLAPQASADVAALLATLAPQRR